MELAEADAAETVEWPYVYQIQEADCNASFTLQDSGAQTVTEATLADMVVWNDMRQVGDRMWAFRLQHVPNEIIAVLDKLGFEEYYHGTVPEAVANQLYTGNLQPSLKRWISSKILALQQDLTQFFMRTYVGQSCKSIQCALKSNCSQRRSWNQ